jgi:tetratricopeptide (TPR) repeat protein
VHVLLGAVLRRSGRNAEALRAFRLAVRLGSLPATRRFVLGEALLGTEGWREALSAWAEARQLEAASGSVILHNAGRRSALNFHPGRPMDRVPHREPPLAPVGPLARLRARREGLQAAAVSLLGGLWRRPRRRDRVEVLRRAWRRVALLALLGAVPAAAAPPGRPVPRGETAAAREQARLCERENLEAGALACRAALALGIGEERRGPVREILARHLVALERWDELADLLREGVQLEPARAEAWQRLGQTLLFALGQPGEAVAALEVAVGLAPADAPARVGLALALHAAGRSPEAAAAFEEALRLDPAVLDSRPAARAVREAIGRGEPWP